MEIYSLTILEARVCSHYHWAETGVSQGCAPPSSSSRWPCASLPSSRPMSPNLLPPSPTHAPFCVLEQMCVNAAALKVMLSQARVRITEPFSPGSGSSSLPRKSVQGPLSPAPPAAPSPSPSFNTVRMNTGRLRAESVKKNIESTSWWFSRLADQGAGRVAVEVGLLPQEAEELGADATCRLV